MSTPDLKLAALLYLLRKSQRYLRDYAKLLDNEDAADLCRQIDDWMER